MTSIPLRKLNGWLFTVNANKVAKHLREPVQQYQEECAEALYSYWGKGFAFREGIQPEGVDRTLSQLLGQLMAERDSVLVSAGDFKALVDQSKQVISAGYQQLSDFEQVLDCIVTKIERNTGRKITPLKVGEF